MLFSESFTQRLKGGVFLMIQDYNNTQYFKIQKEQAKSVYDVIDAVYHALMEKGYNPISQIVGYIMSGDPTYITSHKNARSLIMKVERDEIIEELLKYYVEKEGTSIL